MQKAQVSTPQVWLSQLRSTFEQYLLPKAFPNHPRWKWSFLCLYISNWALICFMLSCTIVDFICASPCQLYWKRFNNRNGFILITFHKACHSVQTQRSNWRQFNTSNIRYLCITLLRHFYASFFKLYKFCHFLRQYSLSIHQQYVLCFQF